MAVLKRKTRALSIRLSEEQFTMLHRASASEGARSVSDFARDLLFAALVQDRMKSKSPSPLEARVEQLVSTVENLILAVTELAGQNPEGLRWSTTKGGASR